MNVSRYAFAVLVAVGSVIACSGSEDEPTPAEQRQQVIDEGVYCCTHDGQVTTPECEHLEPGGVYLAQSSSVDASGRGDACGWYLEP